MRVGGMVETKGARERMRKRLLEGVKWRLAVGLPYADSKCMCQSN